MIEKWKKECIKESSSETIKDTIKIRLYMWELKVNCRRKSLDNRCPICQSEEDTVTKETRNSVGMMRVVKDGQRQQKFKEKTRKIDRQMTRGKSEIYQKNRRRKDSRRRQKLRENRRRQGPEKKKKIQEKDVEEVKDSRRDSKRREKTEQNNRIELKKQ